MSGVCMFLMRWLSFRLLFFMFIGIRRSICHILGSVFQNMSADRSGSEEREGDVVLLLKEVPWVSYRIFICY